MATRPTREVRLAPLPGYVQQLIERSVRRARDPRTHTLMVWGAGDGRQLVAGPVGDLDAKAPGQAQELLERGAAALGKNGDLLNATTLGPQEIEHGGAPAERDVLGFGRAHEPSVHLVPPPARESLSVTPSAASSSRSRSASAKSRCLRACSRRDRRDSIRALSCGSTGLSDRPHASRKPRPPASVTSPPTPMRKTPAASRPS